MASAAHFLCPFLRFLVLASWLDLSLAFGQPRMAHPCGFFGHWADTAGCLGASFKVHHPPAPPRWSVGAHIPPNRPTFLPIRPRCPRSSTGCHGNRYRPGLVCSALKSLGTLGGAVAHRFGCALRIRRGDWLADWLGYGGCGFTFLPFDAVLFSFFVLNRKMRS